MTHKREHFDSYIEQAVHEVEMAFLEYDTGHTPSKAQINRAWTSIGILKALSGYCRHGKYDSIQTLDKPSEDWRKMTGI